MKLRRAFRRIVLGALVATDQRGLGRPFGPRCDIGSYNAQALYQFVYLPLLAK